MKKFLLPLLLFLCLANTDIHAQKKRAAAVNSIIISFPDQDNNQNSNSGGNKELRVKIGRAHV